MALAPYIGCAACREAIKAELLLVAQPVHCNVHVHRDVVAAAARWRQHPDATGRRCLLRFDAGASCACCKALVADLNPVSLT